MFFLLVAFHNLWSFCSTYILWGTVFMIELILVALVMTAWTLLTVAIVLWLDD